MRGGPLYDNYHQDYTPYPKYMNGPGNFGLFNHMSTMFFILIKDIMEVQDHSMVDLSVIVVIQDRWA